MASFDGRQPSMEDNPQWKMTLIGRWPPTMEDDLRWKTTFDWRQPWMEDYLQWKTTLSGRWPSMEDDPHWKMTFNGRRPSMEDTLQWKMISDREISRFCSAIYRCCGHFCKWSEVIIFWKTFVLAMSWNHIVTTPTTTEHNTTSTLYSWVAIKITFKNTYPHPW